MRKNKQSLAYNFANDSFEFLRDQFMVRLRSYVKHSPRCFIRYADNSQKNLTASRFFKTLHFLVFGYQKKNCVSCSIYYLKHQQECSSDIQTLELSFRSKKTHKRHNQGIKADFGEFEVRVFDIQSSLTKMTFVSSSLWTITMSMKRLK